MDFSSDVLIDVGLNLAGYLVAALLVYLILKKHPVNNRTARKRPSASGPNTTASAAGASSPVAARPDVEPEFVSLSETKSAAGGNDRPAHGATAPAGADVPVSGEWRRQNRRAIYAEARRLLARGDSPSDLMTKLPVTESELDMLTVTGRA